MKSRCIVNLQTRIEHRKAGGARREWPVQDAMSRTDQKMGIYAVGGEAENPSTGRLAGALLSFAFGSKPSSADRPRSVTVSPAGTAKMENKGRVAFPVLEFAFVNRTTSPKCWGRERQLEGGRRMASCCSRALEDVDDSFW